MRRSTRIDGSAGGEPLSCGNQSTYNRVANAGNLHRLSPFQMPFGILHNLTGKSSLTFSIEKCHFITDISTVITDIEAKLDAMSVGGLLGLWFQSLFVGLTMKALSICIMLVVYGRMIEIYLVTSVAPIPMATMVNHEWGSMGQNYLKSLLALGFQAFLILVCVGIYAVLIQTIAATDDISGAIWACMGYTVLLCFTLFKTGSLAKSVFSAH